MQRFMLKAAAGGEIINGGKMSSPLSFDETSLLRLYKHQPPSLLQAEMTLYRQGGGGDVTSALLYTAL